MLNSFLSVGICALLAIGVGCSKETDETGAGGRGGGNGGQCDMPTSLSLFYESAGCGAAAPQTKCETAIPSCASAACSCAGKVIRGCTPYYSEPWAYAYFNYPGPDVGSDCDPTAHP